MTSMGPKSLVMKDLPPLAIFVSKTNGSFTGYLLQLWQLVGDIFGVLPDYSAHNLGCDFMASPILSSLG